MKSRGVALILVLVFIMTAVVLANIAVVVLRSQYRFTHHNVSRIQAFYAAQAGVNYALEQLRTGSWTFSPNSCPDPGGCPVNDPDFPNSINWVRVIFCPSGSTCASASTPCNSPAGIDFCIGATVNYAYTP